jgi:hypothetical protein
MLRTLVLAGLLATMVGGSALARPYWGHYHHRHCVWRHHHLVCWR